MVKEEIQQKYICESKSTAQKSSHNVNEVRREKCDRLRINSLRSKMSLILSMLFPTVKAVTTYEKPPEKPPLMRYKSLPFKYDPCTPYQKYMRYKQDEEEKCLKNSPKVLQTALCPTVSYNFKNFLDSYKSTQKFIAWWYSGVSHDAMCAKKKFFCKLRDPSYYEVKSALIALAATCGWVCGSKKGILYRKFFWAVAGATTAGWLFFPNETDVVVRNVSFEVYEFGRYLYSIYRWTPFEPYKPAPCYPGKSEPIPFTDFTAICKKENCDECFEN